jgi:hypothetical protein
MERAEDTPQDKTLCALWIGFEQFLQRHLPILSAL